MVIAAVAFLAYIVLHLLFMPISTGFDPGEETNQQGEFMPRLSKDEKHFGTFTREGRDGEKSVDAYAQWDEAKGGFVLKNAETGRPLLTTAYPTIKEMRDGGNDFLLNGERSPVSEKSDKNALETAAT